jgi:hypothetical protein
VDSCRLAAGAPFSHPDPDRRAGLLKGAGSARHLSVATGEVIAGNGVFRREDVKRQTSFHPKVQA